MSRTRGCFVISPIGDAEADVCGDAKDVLDNLIGLALPLLGARRRDFGCLVACNSSPAGEFRRAGTAAAVGI
jgi:hypothetical protein